MVGDIFWWWHNGFFRGFPFSTTKRFGEWFSMIWMPSSIASSSSHGDALKCWRDRRWTSRSRRRAHAVRSGRRRFPPGAACWHTAQPDPDRQAGPRQQRKRERRLLRIAQDTDLAIGLEEGAFHVDARAVGFAQRFLHIAFG